MKLLEDIENLKTVDAQQEKFEDERRNNKSLKFFEDPNFLIFTDDTDDIVDNTAHTQITNNKVKLKEKMKMQYMSDVNYNKLIKFLIRLYNKKYIMIIRYQKLFSKLKQNQKIKPTGSFIINRNSQDILQGDFLLFLSSVKEELDEYLVLTRRPVSIYARINDIGRFERLTRSGEIIQDFNIAKQECSQITDWDQDNEYTSTDIDLSLIHI